MFKYDEDRMVLCLADAQVWGKGFSWLWFVFAFAFVGVVGGFDKDVEGLVK